MSRPLADESVFRAVAHATRRRMLDYLRNGERPVSELVGMLRLSRPSISQHLRILRTSGLLQTRRRGRGRMYRIDASRLRAIHQWIIAYEKLWTR